MDGKYGDAIVFAVSKTEQLYNTLDVIDAGSLPTELAKAINAVHIDLTLVDLQGWEFRRYRHGRWWSGT